MQSHNNVVQNAKGDALQGAVVSVYDSGTSNLSTIYSDNGSTSQDNPITTVTEGEFKFWAADGTYDITTTYAGQTDTYEITLFDPLRGGSTTGITIGPAASPALFLDISVNKLHIGKGLSTEEANINIGQGRTGNGISTLDLIGDATYTDYGIRVSRLGAGANSASELDHRGTGALNLKARDAGSIKLQTNNTTALTVDSSQDVSIGSTCAFFDVSANQLQIGRNLSTETAQINVGAGRTGDGISKINLIGDATHTDYGVRLIRYAGANAASEIDHSGTGALNLKVKDAGSIKLQTNDITALTVDSSQNIGIGITTPDTNLHVWNGSAGTVAAAAAAIVTVENSADARLQFLTPNTVTQGINFGDPEDDNNGEIYYDHSNNTLSFAANASVKAYFNANGAFINDETYIELGSAGAVTPIANTVLTLENSASAYLQLFTPNNMSAGVVFGDVTLATAGYLTYNHNLQQLSVGVENVEVARFDDDATAGNTRLLIYDVNSATLERVKVGANATGPGGVGRALYIDNV